MKNGDLQRFLVSYVFIDIYSPEYMHKILSHFSSRTCCSAPAPSESLSRVWQCASENSLRT